MWQYERAQLYLMLLGAADQPTPPSPAADAAPAPGIASARASSQLLRALLRLRALGCERARLRRLRRTLVAVVAITGVLPVLAALMPRPLAALTLVWAAPALACLAVLVEERLLDREQRRIRRSLSHEQRHAMSITS